MIFERKGREPLLTSFYTLLLASGVSAFILSSLIFLIPLGATFRSEQESNIRNELKLKVSSNDNLLRSYGSMTESLGSRTMIRQKLIDYTKGAVSLEDLKEFTQPKYEDGAAILKDLVGAARHLPDGTLVASWGELSLARLQAGAQEGLALKEVGPRLFAVITAPIREKDSILGFDTCVFEANILTATDSAIVRGFTVSRHDERADPPDLNGYRVAFLDGAFIITAHPYPQSFRKAALKALLIAGVYSFAFIVSISLFSYFTFYRFVKGVIDDHVSLNQKVSTRLVERDLLLKEVHHRIKNNMNTIASLLSLQRDTIEDRAAKLALQDAEARIHSMSLLYDKLYRSGGRGELPIDSYLSALIDEILANFPNGRELRVEKHIQVFALDAERLQAIGIIVNEVITNAIKHAFKGCKGGSIAISAENNGGLVSISIQDDGPGIPDAVDLASPSGFGLQLIDGYAKQLKADLIVSRQNGTKVELSFKA